MFERAHQLALASKLCDRHSVSRVLAPMVPQQRTPLDPIVQPLLPAPKDVDHHAKKEHDSIEADDDDKDDRAFVLESMTLLTALQVPQQPTGRLTKKR